MGVSLGEDAMSHRQQSKRKLFANRAKIGRELNACKRDQILKNGYTNILDAVMEFQRKWFEKQQQTGNFAA